MLYVFSVGSTAEWYKIGITTQTDIWGRVQDGFWSNKHPPELCNKLDFEGLTLVALFGGSKPEEALLKSLFPPDCGEFWRGARIEEILAMLRLKLKEHSLPEKPTEPHGLCRERLACCGGRSWSCFECGKSFSRSHHVMRHVRNVHRKQRG